MSKTQVFIEKARAVHGDRYDYSKTVYVRSKDKVIITCKEHGDFEQQAGNHLTGYNCQQCAVTNKAASQSYSNAKWVEKANEVHNGAYCYSKTDYKGQRIKVVIGCSTHGFFEQRAGDHLVGKGCILCANASNRDRLLMTGCIFIEKARLVHGDRYDYSKVNYTYSHEKILITCKEHGDFLTTPNKHLRGANCPKCSGRHQYSTAEWVGEATRVHDGKYTYFKSIYSGSHNKITITCKTHGDFEQTSTGHLSGKGCYDCGSLFNRDQPTAVYLMQMGARVKIGISIDPESRLSIINRNNPEPAHIVATWTLKDFPTAYAVEQKLHQRLRDYHAGLTGFDGATEWFNTTPCHAEWVINKAVQYANEVCKL